MSCVRCEPKRNRGFTAAPESLAEGMKSGPIFGVRVASNGSFVFSIFPTVSFVFNEIGRFVSTGDFEFQEFMLGHAFHFDSFPAIRATGASRRRSRSASPSGLGLGTANMRTASSIETASRIWGANADAVLKRASWPGRTPGAWPCF